MAKNSRKTNYHSNTIRNNTMKNKLRFDFLSTYMAAIKNSVGSKFFRNMYARDGRKRIDVLENGNLSCAYFVSTILRHFMLIKKVHSTVKNTVKDLKRSGWKNLHKPKIGSVLVYKERFFPESGNKHMSRFCQNFNLPCFIHIS